VISKQCLEKVGGFDPLFPHYGEDVEYAQRANNFGFKVGLYPKVKAFHFRNQEINRKNKVVFLYLRNLFRKRICQSRIKYYFLFIIYSFSFFSNNLKLIDSISIKGLPKIIKKTLKYT
jgi:GT2 family glycosyltransferase